MQFEFINSRSAVAFVESPFSKNFHDRLSTTIEQNLTPKSIEESFPRTDWEFIVKNQSPECIEFRDWISNVFYEVMPVERLSGVPAWEASSYMGQIKLVKCWGSVYNKENYAENHNHLPFTHSFVYYLKVPEGSSPLEMEGTTFFVRENLCIFFPAHINHSVPPNKSDGRVIIAGNFNWILS